MPEIARNSTHKPTTPSNEPAGLYVIATPIGNLGDITQRALALLGQMDILACEDTRTTRHLLQAYSIHAGHLLAYTEHNATTMGPKLLGEIEAGKRVGLVSDAGTPLVSDPGFRLVEAARLAQLPVFPIPGPSAPIAALMASGLPSERFTFQGFLPPKEGARQTSLQALVARRETLIFFEAPHRLQESLESMQIVFGPEREACVARELTKRFEEFRRGTLAELCTHYATHAARGEIVLLVAPASEVEQDFAPTPLLESLARAAMSGGMPLGGVADSLAKMTGEARKTLYQWLLQCKKN